MNIIQRIKDSGRGRALAGVGLGVLLMIVFIVLPAYISTTAGFFDRFEDLGAKHEQWSTSTHLGAACQQCHAAPTPLGQAAFRARMVGELYLSLVIGGREPRGFSQPANEACIACHSDLRTVSPKGDLRIPHRAHVSALKMRCVECHDFLVHEESPEGKHTPPMSGCMRCHNGDTAKDTCSACHTQKAAPDSHRAADWAITHAEKGTQPDCLSCHAWTERWCADCHRRKPRSHGEDWRAEHGTRIATHRGCEACHEGAFCVRCHGRVPTLNLDPALKLVR